MQCRLISAGICIYNCTILRLRTSAVRSRDCVKPVRILEIGTQFWDSENAQRNLEIAQIPRLRGIHNNYM